MTTSEQAWQAQREAWATEYATYAASLPQCSCCGRRAAAPTDVAIGPGGWPECRDRAACERRILAGIVRVDD